MSGSSTEALALARRLVEQVRNLQQIEVPRLTARNRGLEERVEAIEEQIAALGNRVEVLLVEVRRLISDNAPTRPENPIPEEPLILVEYVPYEGDDEPTQPDNRW